METGPGWLYVPTGNLFKREQVQPSQDHHCHVCVGHGSDHRSILAPSVLAQELHEPDHAVAGALFFGLANVLAGSIVYILCGTIT